MKNVLILLLIIPFLGHGQQTSINWPKIIQGTNSKTILYQPQLESYKDNVLQGRLAASVTKGNKEPVFGTIWFKAFLLTDKDAGTATLRNLEVTNTAFPSITDKDKIKAYQDELLKNVMAAKLVLSISQIVAAVHEMETAETKTDQVNNDPPKIFYREAAAVLVSVDGEPKLQKVEGEKMEYVVNTPFFIVKEKEHFYLKGGKFWYSSTDIKSGYKETTKVPEKVKKLEKRNQVANNQDSAMNAMKAAPEIIVTTIPSELITISGKPQYQSVETTSLLYVKNTENDILMDTQTQNIYVLFAGRFYKSKQLESGSWTFVEPGQLPQDFAKIPPTSDMASVLVSVPGTNEAKEALLAQSIPQTSKVDRKTASTAVKYDGEPKFEVISGTSVAYALNTAATVLLIKGVFYVVDKGIWFEGKTAQGPWVVASKRPEEVEQIPASSRVYNCKYVYVYDSYPDYVYMGYTPGYLSSYVYGGVMVYGTGYYYNPWYGPYYYPGPFTYGFGVCYSPYTGWGFSVGFSYGWIGWGFHPYYGAYWGPRGYYPGYRVGVGVGYHAGYNACYAAGRYNSYRRPVNNNIYVQNRNVNIINRNINNTRINNIQNNNRNNAFSDRQGNVFQREQNGEFRNAQNRTAPSATQRQALQNANFSRERANTMMQSRGGAGGRRR